jgi:hypothetical protein
MGAKVFNKHQFITSFLAGQGNYFWPWHEPNFEEFSFKIVPSFLGINACFQLQLETF